MTGDPDSAAAWHRAVQAGMQDDAAWHRALQAGMQAQRDFRANRDNPEWDSDWDDEAEAILEAVWPHIAAYERAAERQRIRDGIERLRAEAWSGNGYMWPDKLAELLGGAS